MATKNGQFQVIGDEQKLSKGPRSYDRSKFAGGTYQQVGDSVKLGTTPVPMQEGKKNIRDGQFQLVGDQIKMSATPHKGWNSMATPMSDRAIKQSDMPGKKS